MSAFDAKRARRLAAVGSKIGRDGMSLRVIQAVNEFDGSYKGAMELAGRLKAISQMAACDDYWKEKVSIGYELELASASAPPIRSQEDGE